MAVVRSAPVFKKSASAVSAAEPIADWTSDTASFTSVPLTLTASGSIGAVAAGSQIEISSSSLPRFDNFDGSQLDAMGQQMEALYLELLEDEPRLAVPSETSEAAPIQ